MLWAAERVSGIVDWNFAENLLLPETDYAHFALSLIISRRGCEYGDAVMDLRGSARDPAQVQALDVAASLGPNDLDCGLAVDLAWLQHVSFGLQKASELRSNPIWLRNNVDVVVEVMADQG